MLELTNAPAPQISHAVWPSSATLPNAHGCSEFEDESGQKWFLAHTVQLACTPAENVPAVHSICAPG